MDVYFSYHHQAKRLIREGRLIRCEVMERWNNISPALVLFFDNHPPMPIRQEKWQMYLDLIEKSDENSEK